MIDKILNVQKLKTEPVKMAHWWRAFVAKGTDYWDPYGRMKEPPPTDCL